ncbi:MAG TPA: hypothetical protein VKA98_10420, partial [Nitrososphaeraceae archaeon]|nr:hypothetical protein [Nitrososphaeraceae archaeon]
MLPPPSLPPSLPSMLPPSLPPMLPPVVPVRFEVVIFPPVIFCAVALIPLPIATIDAMSIADKAATANGT